MELHICKKQKEAINLDAKLQTLCARRLLMTQIYPKVIQRQSMFKLSYSINLVQYMHGEPQEKKRSTDKLTRFLDGSMLLGP